MSVRSHNFGRGRALAVLLASLTLAAACSSSSKPSSNGASTSTTGASTGATTAPSAQKLKVEWIPGYAATGTPAKYNTVGILKVGASDAKNVLVLEPGTSAGSAYFVPLAQWIVSKHPDWQVWSVERRENLVEDQSELDLAKQGKATATDLYNYYLGYLKNSKIAKHMQIPPGAQFAFAKQWGMNVAVQDLHNVITDAEKLGGRVVLGGHSLGGTVVTAYATWDFGGKAGADGLAGLVFIDGGSGSRSLSAADANTSLQQLNAANASPWLTFGGIPAPYAGVFIATGSAGVLLAPNQPSLGQASGLLPAEIVPPVRVSNTGQYGYALNPTSSPASLAAAQAHLGTGLAKAGPVHGWNGAGALTPMNRFADMFYGTGILGTDGSEWYFPARLTADTGAVDNGNANPAQAVLDVHATMGKDLPKDLLIYAFGAALGGQRVLDGAQELATQSGIPKANLTLVNRSSTYAHNDPNGAYPKNDFFDQLLPFLTKVQSAG
jgi:pimeloyl-ACP methyl ester carboxylesterase